jgi:ferritin-like metal-binding protein YciE
METQTPQKSRHNLQGKNGKHPSSLEDLLENGLKEVYDAEKRMMKALPTMAKSCYNEDLEDAFNKHLVETRKHIERLEKIFRRLEIPFEDGESTCEAMIGLISEAEHILENYEDGHVRDSALIIAAQKIEHYEIACYGSLCELSDVLGYWNICDLLGRTLDDEERTDIDLTGIAARINDNAYEMSHHGYETPGNGFKNKKGRAL